MPLRPFDDLPACQYSALCEISIGMSFNAFRVLPDLHLCRSLAGEYRCPKGPDDLGVDRQLRHFHADDLCQCPDEALILGAATGDGYQGLHADPFEQGEAPLGHGCLDACRDLFGRVAFGQEADYLALGKYTALSGDRYDLVRRER